MPIPEVRPDGYLPEGLFFVTEAEIEAAFGTVNVRRQTLMRRLSYFLQLARAAGALRFLSMGVSSPLNPNRVISMRCVWYQQGGQPKPALLRGNFTKLRWRDCPKNCSSPTQKAVGISGWNSLVVPTNLMDGIRVL